MLSVDLTNDHMNLFYAQHTGLLRHGTQYRGAFIVIFSTAVCGLMWPKSYH